MVGTDGNEVSATVFFFFFFGEGGGLLLEVDQVSSVAGGGKKKSKSGRCAQKNPCTCVIYIKKKITSMQELFDLKVGW